MDAELYRRHGYWYIYIADHVNSVEIDISKAYTGEFNTVKMIPKLNTIDKWMEYYKLEVADYTLYRLSYTNATMILNKRYTTVYAWRF